MSVINLKKKIYLKIERFLYTFSGILYLISFILHERQFRKNLSLFQLSVAERTVVVSFAATTNLSSTYLHFETIFLSFSTNRLIFIDCWAVISYD